jgi:hypothetical protein
MAAVLIFGWASETSARLDPLYTTLPYTDSFANLLIAPAARFDAAWYLAIADHGYEVGGGAASTSCTAWSPSTSASSGPAPSSGSQPGSRAPW